MRWRQNTGTHRHGDVTYGPGDEFDCDVALDEKFNAPGSNKFTRLPDAVPTSVSQETVPADSATDSVTGGDGDGDVGGDDPNNSNQPIGATRTRRGR